MSALCCTHVLLTIPWFSYDNDNNYGFIQVIEESFGLSVQDLLFSQILLVSSNEKAVFCVSSEVVFQAECRPWHVRFQTVERVNIQTVVFWAVPLVPCE